MSDSMRDTSAVNPLLLPEIRRPRMAKANLRKAEDEDYRARIGDVIARTQNLSRLSLKQFAAVIGRNERQVARWITGAERPQLDAILASKQLWAFFVVASAELDHDIEVITEIRVRRRIA